MTERENLDQITESMIGAAIEVHHALGPGLLESAYEACLTFELTQRGLKVEQQKPLPVVYRDVKMDCGYRLDLLVEEAVIVDVMPIHQTQLLSYLKLSGCKMGLLINCNVRALKDGIRRVVNSRFSAFSAGSAVNRYNSPVYLENFLEGKIKYEQKTVS